jgi:hypothetical protein
MNLNPEAPLAARVEAGSAMARGIAIVQLHGLSGPEALHAFENEAGLPLIRASKCPDFVLDRGHWFGEALTEQEKQSLIVFLKSL